MTSDCLVVFCFECLSFCLFCPWVHRDSRPMPQSRSSLCGLHGCSRASCSPVACAQRGREGHSLCSSKLQQLIECRTERWGAHVQVCSENCSYKWVTVSGVHITGSCTPLHAHRPHCCGPLRHSDGRQKQQQDCFASSFVDPVTMLARVGMNLRAGIFIL